MNVEEGTIKTFIDRFDPAESALRVFLNTLEKMVERPTERPSGHLIGIIDAADDLLDHGTTAPRHKCSSRGAGPHQIHND